MKTVHRALLVFALGLMALALFGTFFGKYWLNAPEAQPSVAQKNQPAALVDEQPLATAQQLAALVVAPEEQDFAENALRIADLEVDLAFATALRDATLHAPPLTADARAMLAHVQELQAQVKTQQDDI